MDFGKLFQSIEDAVYEVMVWLMLLPKTLFRSMFRPRWAIQYVDEELSKKPEDRFDEFLSPVLLWLIAAVLPLTISTVLKDGNIRTITELINALRDGLLSQALRNIDPLHLYCMDGMDERSTGQKIFAQGFLLQALLRAGACTIYLRRVCDSFPMEQSLSAPPAA